ncbi:MAG: WG repeat-containing protein, partial [bacterium]|nr:WG repeat-containing protein [bacterium]
MLKKMLYIIMFIMCIVDNVSVGAEDKYITAQNVDFLISYNNQTYTIKNNILLFENRTYLSIRETAELLNLYVVWNDLTDTIEISNIGIMNEHEQNADNKILSTFVNAYVVDFDIKINGYNKQLENNIIVVDGTAYLPLRELSEIFDLDILWNENKRQISIFRYDDKHGERLFPFLTSEGLWGFNDEYGAVKVPPKYTYVGKFVNETAYVMAGGHDVGFEKPAGKYGYIDLEGNEFIPCIYDDALNFSEGLAAVGVYDTAIYDDLANNTYLGEYKYFFIDKNGNKVIDGDYYGAGILKSEFHNGLAPVTTFGKDGSIHNVYINKNGEVVADFGQNGISNFSNGYAKVYYHDYNHNERNVKSLSVNKKYLSKYTKEC